MDDVDLHDDRPMGELARAAEVGDVAEVRRLLAADPSLARTGESEASPLLVACEHVRVEVAELLLAAGADPTDTGKGYHIPAFDRVVQRVPASAELAHLALMHDAVPGVVRVPLCSFDDEVWWCLEVAAANGQFELVELLLQAGPCDVCVLESADRLVADCPEQQGSREEYLLLRYALTTDFDGPEKGGALFLVNRDADLVEELVLRGMLVDQTTEDFDCSFLARKSPSVTMVLLAYGADPNERAHPALFGGWHESRLPVFELLVQAGADVFGTKDSESVADSVCRPWLIPMFELVVFLGARPKMETPFAFLISEPKLMPLLETMVDNFRSQLNNLTHKNGTTVLCRVAERATLPVVDLLLRAGCIVTPTVLRWACNFKGCSGFPVFKKTQVLELLLSHFDGEIPAELNIPVDKYHVPLLRLLRDHNFLLQRSVKNKKGKGHEQLHRALAGADQPASRVTPDTDTAIEIPIQGPSHVPQ